MANCICCGRKIKFSENIYVLSDLFWGDACKECNKKWIDNEYYAATTILDHTPEEVIDLLAVKGFTVIDENQTHFKEVLSNFKERAQKIIESGNIYIPPELVEEKEEIDLETAKKLQEEAERQRIAEEAKQKACAEMLITSGFSFDGYKITKYSGYISGDDAVSIDRGKDGFFFSNAANVGEKLTKSLVQIRRQAINELKEAAYELGCNAVIGVDFDYITLEPETANSLGGTTYLPYVFCVTANGNAVIIEKIED